LKGYRDGVQSMWMQIGQAGKTGGQTEGREQEQGQEEVTGRAHGGAAAAPAGAPFPLSRPRHDERRPARVFTSPTEDYDVWVAASKPEALGMVFVRGAKDIARRT
jgi:hypothetical protein